MIKYLRNLFGLNPGAMGGSPEKPSPEVNDQYSIVPIDDAHEILHAFGIGPESRSYQRWKRENGFRKVDLEDVLSESPRVFGADWREWLQDVVLDVVDKAQLIGIEVVAALDDEGNSGVIRCDDREEDVEYVPANRDDFDEVASAIDTVLGGRAEVRKFKSCEGSDGWLYAMLSPQDWAHLENVATDSLNSLFSKMPME
jgi:hypothetical protein